MNDLSRRHFLGSVAGLTAASMTPNLAFSQSQSALKTKSTHSANLIPVLKKIQEDIERDFIMASDQAKQYGIVDQILTFRARSKE